MTRRAVVTEAETKRQRKSRLAAIARKRRKVHAEGGPLPIPWRINDTYAYLVEAVGCDRVKIGRAQNPSRRLEELQIGSPFQLIIRAVFNEEDWSERALHLKFNHLRTRGEWFKYTDEIRDFILEAA